MAHCWQSSGLKSLKNVSEPMEVYRMVMPWDQVKDISERLDPRRIAVLPFVNISPEPDATPNLLW